MSPPTKMAVVEEMGTKLMPCRAASGAENDCHKRVKVLKITTVLMILPKVSAPPATTIDVPKTVAACP